MKSDGSIFDAIIFDMDGVIIDSSTVVEKVWSEWAMENKIPWENVKNYIHGKRTVETIRQFAPELDEEAVVKTIEDKQAEDINNICIGKGVIDFLEITKNCIWAIVTSNTRTAALNKLKIVQFNPPDVLITGDDVRNGKPSPEGYLMAASTIGVAPENCVVVEDSPVGIEAGKSAGMYVIAVKTTHGETFLRNADMIVDDLYEMYILCSDGLDGKKIRINNNY